MCGICGAIGAEPSVSVALPRMLAALNHRGPDDRGMWQRPLDFHRALGLGNTRLAIQDLTAAGHQPMHSVDGTLTVVFNGEIYNFRTLRAELESSTHRFHSGSDTEVVLAAYRQWGASMVEHLSGMFAFALWDADRRELLLARDRLGIKPLYLARDAARLLFASEVRALLDSGLIERRLSLRGLNGYLALGAVQEPDTLVDGIESLPAGCLAIWRDGQMQVRRYWQPGLLPEARGVTSREAAGTIRGLLEESVRLHSIADVPVGAFLSGGLDSSALVALLAAQQDRPIHTLSLTFPGSDLSEAKSAQLVAERAGSNHRAVPLSGGDLLRLLPTALSAMDQPTFDGVNTFIVSHQARLAGLKVVMSGLGGDEIFAGYPSFRRYPLLRSCYAAMPQAAGRTLSGLASALPGRHDVRVRVRDLLGHAFGSDPFPAVRTLFSPGDRLLLAPMALAAGLPMRYELSGPTSRSRGVRRTSLWELGYYMQNVLLRDADAMSMAHGIELRVPLLDHRLVDYALSLPGDLLLPRGNSAVKPLLAEATRDLIPEAIRGRRKMGFTLPFAEWLATDLRATVEETLIGERCPALDGALDRGAVHTVWQRYLRGESSWHRPWALFVLLRWANAHLGS